MSTPRICATIEARMGSSRLPGKVLTTMCGKPSLELMVERVRRVPQIDDVIIATTESPADAPIEELADKIGVKCFRGSEDDVLIRVLQAAQTHDVDVIVELTGDCPLIDPALISEVIETYRAADVDYVSNILERTFPIGMDTQVFATDVLADVAKRTHDPIDHEHVSLFIYRHPELYSLKNVPAQGVHRRFEDLRLTLDTQEDLNLISAVFEALYPNKPDFDLADIIDFLDTNPDIAKMNADVVHRVV